MKAIQILAFAAGFGLITMNAVAQQQQKVTGGYGVPVLQTEPEFTGGLDSLKAFLHTNLSYPQQLRESGKGANVLIAFIVDERGKIVDVKVLIGADRETNEEALRVVSLMPDWKPGTNGGMPFSKQFVLPIYFAPQGLYANNYPVTQVL